MHAQITRLAALSLTLAVGLSALLVAATADAAPAAIDRVALVEGEGGFAVISYNGGMLLLKADGSPHRVYRYKSIHEGAPDRLRVVDIDGDGRSEVFGLGVPTFMLNKKGDPVWDVPKGCQGFAVANVMGEANKKELVCASGGALVVSTHDGQEVWRYDYKRTLILDVGVGDLGDTGNDDVEFRTKRQKQGFWRISNQGEELGRDFEGRDTQVQDEMAAYKAELTDLMSGKTTFDLNGDGSGEESLKVDGAKVTIGSSGKGKPVAEFDMPGGAVSAAAVGDVDGDGKLEIFLAGPGIVRIVDASGAIRSDVRVDPAAMKREPQATLNGANATGMAIPTKADNIEESDEDALRTLLEQKSFSAVRTCYERRLKSYPLTYRGKVILKLAVNKKGKISGQETLYSDVTDDFVLKCIGKATKKWKVFAATEPGAHMILDMDLGWSDKL